LWHVATLSQLNGSGWCYDNVDNSRIRAKEQRRDKKIEPACHKQRNCPPCIFDHEIHLEQLGVVAHFAHRDFCIRGKSIYPTWPHKSSCFLQKAADVPAG